MRFLILLSTIFLFSFATCNKQAGCEDPIYFFEAAFSIYPNNDSIHINDTIFLELNIPSVLRDVLSNRIVDYSGAVNLGTHISFDKFLDNSGNAEFCASCFELKLINGTFVPDDLLPQRDKDYHFEEKNGRYIFKLAIIPKQGGTFSIGVGNAANVHNSKNKCQKASFTFTFANTNQHLYLYQQNRPGYTPSEYERTHMYCFKVY